MAIDIIARGMAQKAVGGSSGVVSVNGRNGTVTINKNDVNLGNVTNDAQIKRTEMGIAGGVETVEENGKLTHMPDKSDVGLGNLSNDLQVKRSEMGVANGVEILDENSKLTHMPTKSDVGLSEVSNDSQIKRSEMGIANGVETLDANEKLVHMPTKTDVGLGNLSNDLQVKRSEMGVAGGVETLTSDGKLTHMPTKEDIGLSNVLNVESIPVSAKGISNGVVPLNANGKVDMSYLTVSCAKIIGVTNTVSRLALPSYDGFMVVVESDTQLAYGLNSGLDPSVSSNWLPMGDMSSKVASVNNKTGVVTLDKTDVSLSNVDNTADTDKNVLSATKLSTARKINGVNFDGTTDITIADNTKEPIVIAGTISQYYRGDKTFQTLDKSTIGLSNCDNTSDVNKPISTATQTALNNKLDTNASGKILEWGGSIQVEAAEARKCMTTAGGFYAGQLMRSKETRTTGTIFNATEAAFWESVGAGVFIGATSTTNGEAGYVPAPISGKQNSLLRGDGLWTTVDKTFVGLGNVDNTADSNKNVLSATRLSTPRKIYGTSFDGTSDITPTFLQLDRGLSDQTLVGANSDLIFNESLVSSGNIPFNSTTGVITLTANHWYELSGEPVFNTFSDTTNGYMIVDWVDATTNVAIISYNHAIGTFSPHGDNRAYCFYKPTTNQSVKLRVTSASGTATFTRNNGSKAIIKQIG